MQGEIAKIPHLGKIFSKGDLKCEATCLINEDYWCDYNGTTQGEGEGGEELYWAECINRKAGEERREEEKMLDLCGTVQNPIDELDQLLHGLNRLTGQEVLLVGCVEDDNRGHRHLAEKKKEEAQRLIVLTPALWAAIIKVHH